jgi:hypothetical protein
MACLASRVPYGTAINVEMLDQIGAAEAFLRSLGVRQLRVRHHGEIARIEVDQDGMDLLMRGNRDLPVRHPGPGRLPLGELPFRLGEASVAGGHEAPLMSALVRPALAPISVDGLRLARNQAKA